MKKLIILSIFLLIYSWISSDPSRSPEQTISVDEPVETIPEPDVDIAASSGLEPATPGLGNLCSIL